jgi:hypothetical protein
MNYNSVKLNYLFYVLHQQTYFPLIVIISRSISNCGCSSNTICLQILNSHSMCYFVVLSVIDLLALDTAHKMSNRIIIII